MSSGFHVVGLEFRALVSLIQSIGDLSKEYHQLATMRDCDGTVHKVDVLVKDPNGKDIGFEKTEEGTYRMIADTGGLSPAQLKAQEKFIKQIKQRYAYHTVIEQLKKQGYVISEEEKVPQNTIRLVARKWS